MFSIFRHESETKEDESITPAVRTQKSASADDEVQDDGYFTIPPIQTLASNSSVPNFVVVRKGYGSISFSAPVDLTGISSLSLLREIVQIDCGRVTVYPNKTKEHPQGSGLNVAAQVLLENVRPPPDVELDEFLRDLQSKPDTKFMSYAPDTGKWTFKVDHFSSYSVLKDRHGAAFDLSSPQIQDADFGPALRLRSRERYAQR
jgi:Nucleoporin autopeptidase